MPAAIRVTCHGKLSLQIFVTLWLMVTAAGKCVEGVFSPSQVIEIRNLKGKKTQAEIAAMFGVKEPTIRDIYLGRTFQSIHS